MTALARVEAALASVGSARVGVNWRCPAHDDRNPSLSVSAGRSGGAVVHCHAGCDTERVLSAISLQASDLFDDESVPRRDGFNVVETYAYTDELGAPLFEVVRLDPKSFRQRRFDPRDAKADGRGYVWGLGVVRRVLFRLPAVVEAAGSGRGFVFVCEGEKDVLALEASGELERFAAVATTMPGGAGKWRPEFSEVLRGCDVMVVADRDDAGRRHALDVARALDGIAGVVDVAEPRIGKDLADHLAAGLGVADLVRVDIESPEEAAVVVAEPPQAPTASPGEVATHGAPDRDWIIPSEGVIKDWCDLYTPMGESPPEMHAGAAVALLSAAIGWRMWLVWQELHEPVTLNVMLTGTSGTARKTTTASAARRIAEIATADMDHPRPLVVRSISHTSDRGLMELVKPRDQHEADEWQRNPPPGQLWSWDEFGAILGRPGDGKGGDWLGNVRATLMKLTAGYQGGVQLGQTQYVASRCAVSILGTVTKAELQERARLGLIADGFLGRLTLVPYSGTGQLIAVPPKWTTVDTDRRERIIRHVRRIVASPPVGNGFDLLTKDGLALRRDWYHESGARYDREAAEGDEVAVAVKTAFGRLQSIAMKLACVQAASRYSDLATVRLDEDAVGWGIGFADYALEEIRSLAESGIDTPSDAYARKVVDWVRSRGRVSRKALLDGVRGGRLTRAQRWAIVEQLHHDGSVTVETVGAGGRPVTYVSSR